MQSNEEETGPVDALQLAKILSGYPWRDLPKINPNMCFEKHHCDHQWPYRYVAGDCNNPNTPDQGVAMLQLYRRHATARFRDGVAEIALAESGRELPSARTLALTLFERKPNVVNNHKLSLLTPYFVKLLWADSFLPVYVPGEQPTLLSLMLMFSPDKTDFL
jgi:hypothetical protein